MLHRRIQFAAATALAAMMAAAAALIIWSAPRGFDLLDSGVYYLSYQSPRDVADLNSSYHWFGRVVFLAVGQDVTLFRLASWACTISAVAFFAHGLLRWLASDDWAVFSRAQALVAHLALQLAGLAVFAITAPALTYNSLNTIALLLSTGCVLHAFAAPPVPPARSLLFLGVAAAIAFGQLFVKPTTSLLTLAFLVVAFATTPEVGFRTKVRIAVGTVTAGAAGLGSLWLITGPNGPIIVRLGNFVHQASGNSYTAALLEQLWRDLAFLGERCLRDSGGFIVAALAATVLVRALPRPRLGWHAFAAAALLSGAWIAFAAHRSWAEHGHVFHAEGRVTRCYISALGLLSAFAAATRWLAPSNRISGLPPRTPLVLGWLCLAPFAGAVGTNNPIHLNATFAAALWLAAGVFLCAALDRWWHSRGAITAVMATVLGGLALSQFATATVRHPYGLSKPLTAQSVSTAVGYPASQLLLDSANSAFINETRRLLEQHGFKPGDDVFAFFNLPGLVFAVGGRSPGIPWYFGRIYVGDEVEAYYLRQVAKERKQRAFVVTQDDVTRFREHFARGELNFPDGFRQVGQLLNPNNGLVVRVWAPVARALAP